MEVANPARGVFWVIEGNLTAFPFVEGTEIGAAKSGINYNHQKLWEHVKPKGCRYPFGYYPRGRVEFNRKGRPIIYMSPHIDLSYIPEISKKFGLQGEPIIRYDGSRHYRCYLDYEDSLDG